MGGGGSKCSPCITDILLFVNVVGNTLTSAEIDRLNLDSLNLDYNHVKYFSVYGWPQDAG